MSSAPPVTGGSPAGQGAVPTPVTSRRQRLALVAALYSTQNLSLGFFSYGFLTIAQARGVSLAAIGAAAGVATLLVLKFLWAPLVDRHGSRRWGHYRGWLILTQSTLGLGAAALALFDPAEDRGLGNGFQSAGSSLAQVVGGGVILLVYHAAGWQVAALTLAAFSLVALPFVLAWREEDDSRGLPVPRVTLRSALGFFADARVRLWALVLMPAYTAGATVAYNLVRPMLVDAGKSEGWIGLYVVIGGSIVGVLAGVTAGAFISSVGNRRALVRLGVLQVAATLGTLPIALGAVQPWLVLGVVALSNGAFAAAFAVIFTISMGLTRPESAGTDFTFFTTISSLLMVICGGGGIALAGALGFPAVVAGAAVLAVLGLLVVVRLSGVVLGPDRGVPSSAG